MKPICPICNEPIIDVCDMHEALLTRGDFPKNDKIMVSYNCVLVHTGECHQKAATKEGQVLCMKDLLKHETPHEILAWLSMFRKNTKGKVPDQARLQITEVMREMQRLRKTS